MKRTIKKSPKNNAKNKNTTMAKTKTIKIKVILFTLLAIAIISTGVSTFFVTKKKQAEKTVNVAFYGLSENYIQVIKDQIPSLDEVIVKYTILAEGKFDPAIVSSKYDMLFTWKGEYTQSLEASAEDIPGKLLENIPNSLKNKKCIPLLIDNWEVDFHKDTVSKVEVFPYADLDNALEYLIEAKAHVFVPFFMAGGDDRTLLAFLTSVVESKGGLSAYAKFISVLQDKDDFTEIIDSDLGKGLTLRSILDTLKTFPKEGLTHPSWYYGNESDVSTFAGDNQIGVFYTNLSRHRKMEYKTVRNFETSSFPRSTQTESHGIIAPSICGMLLSSNSNCKKMLASLVSLDAQSIMSNSSMLAPVHVRAESYDRQADDVRFWAASCAGGALPDAALAAYQKKPDSLTNLANEIRSYLKRP